MSYVLRYHPQAERDLFDTAPQDSLRVHRTLQKKLKTSPLAFGVYLHGVLHPHRKLRIGSFRVVYRVLEKEGMVFVIAVGLRKDNIVYQKALKRL